MFSCKKASDVNIYNFVCLWNLRLMMLFQQFRGWNWASIDSASNLVSTQVELLDTDGVQLKLGAQWFKQRGAANKEGTYTWCISLPVFTPGFAALQIWLNLNMNSYFFSSEKGEFRELCKWLTFGKNVCKFYFVIKLTALNWNLLHAAELIILYRLLNYLCNASYHVTRDWGTLMNRLNNCSIWWKRSMD